MALIKCYECGAEISTGAKACPHCGAKRKSQAGKLFLVFIFIGMIIEGVGAAIHTDQEIENTKIEAARIAALTPEQRAEEQKKRIAEQKEKEEAGKETSAVYVCRDFVKKMLKDPDSIEYVGMYSETPVSKEKDGSYKVAVTVRAKNSFGAKVPSVFVCRTRQTGKENWTLVDLKEVPM